MSSEHPEPSWRIRESTVFRELDGEAVVLSLDSSTYFGLNQVGTAIWQLVEQHGRVSEVADALARQYDVSHERARADVIDLMTQLVEKGLAEPL